MLWIEGLECLRGSGAAGFRLRVPSLSVAAGEAVAVVGPSGSGKSTLLDLLGLVLRPSAAGRFAMQDTHTPLDVAALWRERRADPLARLRAARIGYILQTGGLLPFLDVRENIRLSLRLLGQALDPPHLPALLSTLGIGHLQDKMPAALSVGERQRVATARALAHRPALVLADEPTASLDPGRAALVMDLLFAAVRDMGASLVVVSHDWDRVRRLPVRCYRAVAEEGGDMAATRIEEGGP